MPVSARSVKEKRELKTDVGFGVESNDIGVLFNFRAASLLVAKIACACFSHGDLSSELSRCICNDEGVGNLVVSFLMGVVIVSNLISS